MTGHRNPGPVASSLQSPDPSGPSMDGEPATAHADPSWDLPGRQQPVRLVQTGLSVGEGTRPCP